MSQPNDISAAADPASILHRLLALRDGSPNILQNRENSQLEFKETFNLGSLAKYARTMAAFANNRGGYIVFGVADSPHRLKGVNTTRFDECDPAQITRFLNSHFGPELEWEMNMLVVAGVSLGYIYTREATDKPIVGISNAGTDVKDGDIYYRYKGQTSTIRYPELRALIDSRIASERQAWLQHLRTIDRVGPRNVGILDTIHGKLYGAGPPFLIDETLLRQLKFIRQGEFSESEGIPTLRVLGDVQAVNGMAEKPVPTGIHSDDLITAFLAQRPLNESEARSYLREATYQNTPYIPIHYLLDRAKLSVADTQTLINESHSTSKSQKKALVNRINGTNYVKPISTVDSPPTISQSSSQESLFEDGLTEKNKRTLLLGILERNSAQLQQAIHTLPLTRLCEAVTHLAKERLRAQQKDVLELLLSIFTARFQQASDAERSAFRKAVAYCDERLFCRSA